MKNYHFIMAVRQLRKEKFYAAINCIGLSVAVYCCIVIGLYIEDELSYDKFHTKHERIYRVWNETNGNQIGITPYIWTQPLRQELPEVENSTSAFILSTTIIKRENLIFSEPGVLVTDSMFLKIFDYSILESKKPKENLLNSPGEILLTRAMAKKYFGKANPLGEVLELNLFGAKEKFEVTAIIECPSNSHLKFDFVVPHEKVAAHSFNPRAYTSWSISFLYNFLLIKEGSDLSNFPSQLKELLQRHAGEQVADRFSPGIEPLGDVYLKSEKNFDPEPGGSYSNLQTLAVVAMAILFIGIINFVNLTTSRAFTRTKSVYLRKIFGSGKGQVIRQFLVESLLLSGLAFGVAIMMTGPLSSFNENITGKNFGSYSWLDGSHLAVLCFAWLVTGIVSGIYPGFLIASVKATKSLGSKSGDTSQQSMARKSLAVFQVICTAILICFTLVIWNQLSFMQEKKLGFIKEQVLIIKDGGIVSSKLPEFKRLREELEKLPFVSSVTASSSYPGSASHWVTRFMPEGTSKEEALPYSIISADFHYAATFGLEVVEGRGFEAGRTEDSVNYLINEAALKAFAANDSSWLSNPFAKNLHWIGGNRDGKVIGVVRDFHFESLKKEIGPLIILNFPPYFFNIEVKLGPASQIADIGTIESTWGRLFPEVPISWSFADDEFASTFKTDQRMGKIFVVFAGLSVFIAMLGILGMAASMVHQKSKEVSIRKVVGASGPQIMALISIQFLKMVMIANLLAFPVVYFLSNRWLDNFAYRTDWSWSPIFITLAITFGITLVTVAYHTVRISRINPTQVLAGERGVG